MHMLRRIILANVRYHKRKNILTGLAMILTTMLLFLVPSVGLDLIDEQKAAVNMVYPRWFGMFSDVTKETANKLEAHHMTEKCGLMAEVATLKTDDADYSFVYVDQGSFELYNMKLISGKLPEAEDEIMVTAKMLKDMGSEAKVGDSIEFGKQEGTKKIPLRFTVSGIYIPCTESVEKAYACLVSRAFLEKVQGTKEPKYNFIFGMNLELGSGEDSTDRIKQNIGLLADTFGIKEKYVTVNDSYIWANYEDPTIKMTIVVVMIVIVLIGAITLYGIYYISVGERIREIGKLKAVGATTGQLKRVILGEGMLTAAAAIPAGLLIGTLLVRVVLELIMKVGLKNGVLDNAIRAVFSEGKVMLYRPELYFITVVAALLTVLLSLLRPMKTVAGISEVEAMRYSESTSKKANKKGYRDLSVFKLTLVHLKENKRKNLITIFSMGLTALLFMVVASVFSSSDPVDAANEGFMGEYEVLAVIAHNDERRPEREWRLVQKNNPLNEELKKELLSIPGIRRVEEVHGQFAKCERFEGEMLGISGVNEEYADMLINGITEGHVTYEDLKSGDKVIAEKNMLVWYPELSLGDVLEVEIDNGDEIITKKIEIAAIGDYSLGFSHNKYLYMAEEAVDRLSNYSTVTDLNIYADEKYDPETERAIKALCKEEAGLRSYAWKDEYEQWKTGISVVRTGCYAFLAILGAICIMNIINTMVSSVNSRRKEFGIYQAVGMSDRQLFLMMFTESLFYTLGIVIIAVGAGSFIGFRVYLLAKDAGVFNLHRFIFPKEEMLLMIVALVLLQFIITVVLNGSLRKESVIDRVRFNG